MTSGVSVLWLWEIEGVFFVSVVLTAAVAFSLMTIHFTVKCDDNTHRAGCHIGQYDVAFEQARGSWKNYSYRSHCEVFKFQNQLITGTGIGIIDGA